MLSAFRLTQTTSKRAAGYAPRNTFSPRLSRATRLGQFARGRDEFAVRTAVEVKGKRKRWRRDCREAIRAVRAIEPRDQGHADLGATCVRRHVGIKKQTSPTGSAGLVALFPNSPSATGMLSEDRRRAKWPLRYARVGYHIISVRCQAEHLMLKFGQKPGGSRKLGLRLHDFFREPRAGPQLLRQLRKLLCRTLSKKQRKVVLYIAS